MGPTCPTFIRIRTNAKLYNRFGEDFIEKAIPDWRFKATRDTLSIYIYKEIIEGRGTKHGGVFMDLSFLKPELIKDRLSVSNYYEKVLKSGVDLTKDTIEITPAAHYFMGGIRIDVRGETSIPGVFACGESAAGFHGANRLGGNSLSEILVSGSHAGENAGKRAAKMKRTEENNPDTIKKRINRITYKINRWKSDADGVRPVELKNKLRNMMWEKAGVIRDGQKLKDGINRLDLLEKQMEDLTVCAETQYNRDLLDAFELKHMFNVSRLILKGALMREESRGAHFRQDYPEKNNEKWLVNIIFKKDNELKAPIQMKH